MPKTYYANPSGNDSNDGLSTSTAFKTLQQCANVVAPGDVVIVTSGSYVGFEATISGTATAPISFLAQSGVIITSKARSTDNVIGIDLNHVNYNIIDGFTVPCLPFSGYIGIRSYGGLNGQAIGNVIHNNVISNAGYVGILASWQQSGRCENNTITGSVRDGIYYGNSGTDCVLTKNTIKNMGKHGLVFNGDATNGGPGLMLRMTIDSNIIDNTGTDASQGDGCGIVCQGVQNSRISNNLITHAKYDGIRLDQGPDAAGGSDSNIVCNNTINLSGSNNLTLRQASNNIIFNNVLYNDTSFGSTSGRSLSINQLSYDPVGNISDYNALGYAGNGFGAGNLAWWQSNMGLDLHSIDIGGGTSGNDPRNSFWVNWSYGDYHLVAGCSLIDSGTTSLSGATAPSVDLDSNQRTSADDMGAYEYGSVVISSSTSSSSIAPPPPPPPPPSSSSSSSPTVNQTYQLFTSTVVPATPNDPDAAQIEVGVKFRTDVAGTISAIRFYKGSQNTGSKVVSLWNSAGKLLAQATSTKETASGWQQVNLATPITISPNATYVASYNTSSGHYSDDPNYFSTKGIDVGPLHALKAGVDGVNGVYIYGKVGTFPTQNYLSSNYYVDVIFSTTVASSSSTPVVVSDPVIYPHASSAIIFNPTISVTMKSVNGTIYYTTDGSTPTINSTKYTTPINVTTSQTVKAIAILNGVSSNVVSDQFTLG
jgi:hypothetical protein